MAKEKRPRAAHSGKVGKVPERAIPAKPDTSRQQRKRDQETIGQEIRDRNRPRDKRGNVIKK